MLHLVYIIKQTYVLYSAVLIQFVGPLKALYTSPSGRRVHCETISTSTAEWTGSPCRERKCPNFETVTKCLRFFCIQHFCCHFVLFNCINILIAWYFAFNYHTVGSPFLVYIVICKGPLLLLISTYLLRDDICVVSLRWSHTKFSAFYLVSFNIQDLVNICQCYVFLNRLSTERFFLWFCIMYRGFVFWQLPFPCLQGFPDYAALSKCASRVLFTSLFVFVWLLSDWFLTRFIFCLISILSMICCQVLAWGPPSLFFFFLTVLLERLIKCVNLHFLFFSKNVKTVIEFLHEDSLSFELSVLRCYQP